MRCSNHDANHFETCIRIAAASRSQRQLLKKTKKKDTDLATQTKRASSWTKINYSSTRCHGLPDSPFGTARYSIRPITSNGDSIKYLTISCKCFTLFAVRSTAEDS